MKKGLLGFIVVIFLVITIASVGFAQDMGIITGGKKGTYYHWSKVI